MKFAICNEIFQGWELEKQFETAAEVGFDGIEIAPFTMADSVLKIDAEQRRRIRELSKQYGVEVVGIHWLLAGTSGYHVTDPDPEVRARTREYLKELVRFGVEIGGAVGPGRGQQLHHPGGRGAANGPRDRPAQRGRHPGHLQRQPGGG